MTEPQKIETDPNTQPQPTTAQPTTKQENADAGDRKEIKKDDQSRPAKPAEIGRK